MLERGDTVTVKPVVEKCLVLGDSIVRNAGAQKPNEGRVFSGDKS